MTRGRWLLTVLSAVVVVVSGCAYAEAPGMTGPQEHAYSVPMTPLRALPRVVTPGEHITGGVYPASCAMQGAPAAPRPDRRCTPGSVLAEVTQDTIVSTICRPGWTGTVRPGSSETDRLKTVAMRSYGVPDTVRSTTELDHFVPLALGGSNDVDNLWPQTGPGPGTYNLKDHVEERLQDAVCEHRVTLDAARTAIVADWTTALRVTGAGA